MLGVGAAKEDGRSMILTGLAGAVAGACSMAVGEFVSVSTQRDIEKVIVSHSSSKNGREDAPAIMINIPAGLANIEQETKVGESNRRVSTSQPMEKASPSIIVEAVLTPGRFPVKEDDTEEVVMTNPYKAAAASALSFLCGSSVPMVPAIAVTQNGIRMIAIAVITTMALALFGGVGAYLGGSPIRMSAVRVMAGGWIAMGITYGLLKPFDNDDKESKL
ncbi:hypothetical protein JCGZ_24290 [Jatropha curcas]|uniref:Vacuolar iron transporter n=1 Tax=Jatropha curcas TaxID=180498 RepID=A0A067JLZ8_JATCU|nr:hypothetical protein JCGZ_24290 [Jatropha curcas]